MNSDPSRPNIVLIMADQWRGDCLSVAGHPTVHTPYLDDASLRGVRFDCAYSATPICIPARAALWTGMKQENHGRVGYRDDLRWDYPVNLAGCLSDAGYQTEAIGKMHVYPERHRMGFDHVTLHGALGILRRGAQEFGNTDMVDDYQRWLRLKTGDPTATAGDGGVSSNAQLARPWDKPEETHYTRFVADECIDFLRRRDPTCPFFMYMSFNAPHPPYDPPQWAFDHYIDMAMPDPPRGDWMDIMEPWRGDFDATPTLASLPPERLQRARAGYYGAITFIDYQIFRFQEALRWAGLENNTWLIFCSDHGEMLGDHDLFRKGYGYEGSAHIPFLIIPPTGTNVVTRGGVSDAVVELRDIMPTVLDIAGVEIPETVDGHSLMPVARGEQETVRDWLHGECTTLGQSHQWVTDGKTKYVWFSRDGYEQLFDLVEDPQECVDLARQPKHAGRLAEWRGKLIEALAEREEGFVKDGELSTVERVHPVLRHYRERVGVA